MYSTPIIIPANYEGKVLTFSPWLLQPQSVCGVRVF